VKKTLYNLINKLGYRIEKKAKDKSLLAPYLLKYKTSKFDKLYDSKEYIHALSQKFIDFNLFDNEDGFLVSFNNLSFYIEGDEEFYILNEIFVENDYHFETSKKSIVIDIGANVGVASTYFSTLDFVKKIYAFEPVLATYQQAKQNLELNNLSQKVTIQNFGLGDTNKKTKFLFDPNSKGSAGLSSVKSDRYIGNTNAIEIEVEIKNSYEVLQSIIEMYPNYQIVIKMDCEGAENEILPAIQLNKLIHKVDVFMIEWHHDNYDFITQILLDNNFSFFTKNVTSIAGLILAFKKE